MTITYFLSHVLLYMNSNCLPLPLHFEEKVGDTRMGHNVDKWQTPVPLPTSLLSLPVPL